LLTGSSSIRHALHSGANIGAIIGESQPEWRAAADTIDDLIGTDQSVFEPKLRWAMLQREKLKRQKNCCHGLAHTAMTMARTSLALVTRAELCFQQTSAVHTPLPLSSLLQMQSRRQRQQAGCFSAAPYLTDSLLHSLQNSK
jgi:hypothetical protein